MAKNAATGSGTGNQVIGKVFIIYGTVKAVAPDGTVRILALNSPSLPTRKSSPRVTAASPSCWTGLPQPSSISAG